jgi:hypothetical protein
MIGQRNGRSVILRESAATSGGSLTPPQIYGVAYLYPWLQEKHQVKYNWPTRPGTKAWLIIDWEKADIHFVRASRLLIKGRRSSKLLIG